MTPNNKPIGLTSSRHSATTQNRNDQTITKGRWCSVGRTSWSRSVQRRVKVNLLVKAIGTGKRYEQKDWWSLLDFQWILASLVSSWNVSSVKMSTYSAQKTCLSSFLPHLPQVSLFGYGLKTRYPKHPKNTGPPNGPSFGFPNSFSTQTRCFLAMHLISWLFKLPLRCFLGPPDPLEELSDQLGFALPWPLVTPTHRWTP